MPITPLIAIGILLAFAILVIYDMLRAADELYAEMT